jgi:NAD(P)-dependent dehydrogenase (short-subunit alcohol dehydrogenase family)
MTLTIADRAILITGANRGIGQALVEDALQRQDLVAKTEIVHAARAEISQHAEPVGDPDDDDAAAACKLVGVVLRRFTPARHVRAAMQPDHDG